MADNNEKIRKLRQECNQLAVECDMAKRDRDNAEARTELLRTALKEIIAARGHWELRAKTREDIARAALERS